ncbi:hypoxia-inducible factor 1-alpha-like protein [Leptotrombidium deliense]|uniref:Hypoxia-inducible factor 1-alpha-like protein n=1 Tax=Leptotrombidium deliense TaxID=299467 RepID=A0A443SG39_9ACAR|nr:hypoxia-inducible factor 1-alpha-like protein [Leptotrombidium deliense]
MQMYNKSQTRTGYYRFLAKSGGYLWLQSEATLINDNNGQPFEIVSVNYVIRGEKKLYISSVNYLIQLKT